jgi:hypothetical protein
MYNWDNLNDISQNNLLGATVTANNFPQNIQHEQIKKIREYVSSKGNKFQYILRMNQPEYRYKYLTYIKTDPMKKSTKFKDHRVIGLFYECKYPQKGITYKQDLIIEKEYNYIFIIGQGWLNCFPELTSFKETGDIISPTEFKGLIATNGKYGFKEGNIYNHHYKNIRNLPKEVQNDIKQHGVYSNE